MHVQGSSGDSYASSSDAELIHAFQKEDDQQALVVLLRRYSGYVIAFAGQHLKDSEAARDFSQELFLVLREKLRKTEVRNFKPWLYTVMRNLFLDGARRVAVHRKVLELLPPAEAGYSVEREIDLKLFRPRLEAALESLTEPEERCIRAIYLEEKSYAEVMAETGWKFNQMRGLRERAMKKLRKQLGQL